MFKLMILTLLIVYLSDVSKANATDDWFVPRQIWEARTKFPSPETFRYKPFHLVIISNTMSPDCDDVTTCAATMRNLQSHFYEDIPYNFVIGNDGKVYEGRGWNDVGDHTLGFNQCSLGLAFNGDYRYRDLSNSTRVTKIQEATAQMLLQQGVTMGYLHPRYVVVGARDLQSTKVEIENPGNNLYHAIKLWERYDYTNRFKDHSCAEIHKVPIFPAEPVNIPVTSGGSLPVNIPVTSGGSLPVNIPVTSGGSFTTPTLLLSFVILWVFTNLILI